MKFSFHSFVFALLALFIISCGDDDDCCVGPELSGDVYVVSEGQFLQGNASLEIYNSDAKSITNGVFAQANGRGIGDVLQSITFNDNLAYLIVNNSQRIEVINVDDHSLVTTITGGFSSPRYGVVVGDNLYVSELFTPEVHIIDLNTNTITGTIATEVPVEELVVHNNLIFASANNFLNPLNKVYVINTETNTVTDEIEVGANPNSMIKDGDEFIWVMCTGIISDSITIDQSLYRINTTTLTVDKSFEFTGEIPSYPGRLAINGSGDELYFDRSSGIRRLNIDATSLPSATLIPVTGSLYGIGINPINGDIYLADPVDFQSPGVITIYDEEGTLLDSQTTGVNPSRFYFR